MKTYQITLNENQYNAVLNAINDAKLAQQMSCNEYHYLGSMTKEEYEELMHLSYEWKRHCLVKDDADNKRIKHPELSLYNTIVGGGDRYEIVWNSEFGVEGINVMTMAPEIGSECEEGETYEIYFHSCFREFLEAKKLNDIEDIEWTCMVDSVHEFTDVIRDVINNPSLYGADYAYLLTYKEVIVGIAICRPTKPEDTLPKAEEPEVTENNGNESDLAMLDKYFEGRTGDFIHSSNVESTSVDKDDHVETDSGHEVEMVWYSMKDDGKGNMAALKIDGEYFFADGNEGADVEGVYPISLDQCPSYAWQSVEDKTKYILIDSGYNHYEVDKTLVDLFNKRMKNLNAINKYHLFSRYPKLGNIEFGWQVWAVEDMDAGNEKYRVFYANENDEMPLFVIDLYANEDDRLIYGDAEYYKMFVKVRKYLEDHDIFCKESGISVSLWNDDETINIDGSCFVVPCKADLEWMCRGIDEKNDEINPDDDIVTKFQKVTQKALDNGKALDNAGSGMYNVYLSCFGSEVIVQVYPNDEWHHVWILIRTESIDSDTEITDYPEGMQKLIYEAYCEAVL